MRFSVDEENLQALVEHPDLKYRKIPLVIILNKQDKENAFHKAELRDFLGLEKLKTQTKMSITIRECKGKEGAGFNECLSYFTDHLV